MNFFRSLLQSAAKKVASGMVRPGKITSGSIEQCQYQSAELTIAEVRVFQVVFDLPSGVGGTVYVVPNDGQKPLWNLDGVLESIEFNDRMLVFASERSLAFRVLGPDFMSWLLDCRLSPQFYIIGQKLFVAFVKIEVLEKEKIDVAARILKFVLRSGALEKK